MAARRGKSQATRNSSQATPAWVWLILGLLIGLAVYFVVPGLGKKDGDGFFRPTPNPDAQPAPVDSADVEAVVPDAPSNEAPATAPTTDDAAAKETQYDFYTLLPGKEVQMSDAELAASAREEEARKARAALNGQATTPVAAAPAAAAATQPTPINETAPARPAETPRTADAPPAPKPAPTVASADTGARYILQAGAFGASGDAEATKAKIAMLGLSARVESAQINGKTVYRVRMGPYGTASELAEAKQKLASGGLPAMAVKAQ
ncbi:SPOR domain-containing protein [Pseudoxanthomonas sp. PXM03]|uniref:SPOR domain-containing protein n=1 Tax=Pseudoxanthomonas sp. PXM03 TaxID=2769284 RepID=UPI0017853CA0|nr:SPOR domain-containing protein [Pseudoxanthomonas sp. PXM03]MBD9434697.1 SPOR domain-containing protein [Pseudoxanthomonas sp. PXM03]